MPRIKGQSVQTAMNVILEKIENYEYVAGDIISDLELSKVLNMSRTPIREAIMSLIENGILERTATKVVVKPITLSDICEIFDVREAIEHKSLELIIQAGGLTKEQKDKLLQIHEQLCQNIINGNFQANFEADDIFHKTMIEFSGNTRLLGFYDTLTLQSRRLRWISMFKPVRYTQTREEHAQIIDFLCRKDLESAKKALSQHFSNSITNYSSILNTPHWNRIANEITSMTATKTTNNA